MKWPLRLVKAASLVSFAAFFGSIAGAQTTYSNSLAGFTLIYSNAFNGPAINISNTPPNYTSGLFGGGDNAVWIDAGTPTDTNAFYANGNVGTAQGDSILLPFQPQSGHVYILTASVTFSGNPGSWIGAGFAQNYAMPGIGNARFADDGVNGYDFAILTESSENVQYFAGPHAEGQFISQNGFFSPALGTHTIKLILDTTAPKWAIACFVDGVQAATNAAPYSSNPPIAAVGITQTALTAGAQAYVHWNSFTLSAAQLIISQQPASATVFAGLAFTDTVVAAGAPPFFYQWYTNGVAVVGATNASLILNPASLADSGNYDVVVTNNYGAITSAVASVTVYSAQGRTMPPFLAQSPPTNITVAANESLTIPALAAGSPSLTGTWYDPNGNVLAVSSTNGTVLNADLTVDSVPGSWNDGQLELSVTNDYGATNVFVSLDVVSNYVSTVNPGSVLVTNFQGWGTSLQWWANVIGSYPNRTNFINLIFDTLKLNVVRYEIGAGQNPSVNNPRTPYKANMQGFELTNGLWNWNADLNQRWVLQQAEANGANVVEAFAVSPPWWMCVSSNVDGNMAGTNNLQVDCETNYANYLATVVSNLTVLDGDHFNYLIPMNEPSLGTVGQETNGYETCHVSNDQQQRLINDLRAQLNTSAPSVGIDAPGDYDEYEAYTDLKEYSATTLGNLALFSTHSYIQNEQANLSAEAASQRKPLWVAEYGDSDSTGLTMAQHIHDDITSMKLQAWVYWMAVNSDAGNAFLYSGLASPTNSGYSTNYIIYEKFYAMGQYSEFVRPGCEILSVNDPYTLAAYNPTNSSLALVMVNTNNTSFGVTYNLQGFGSIPWQTVTAFQTSAAGNMAAQPSTTIANGQFTAIVPPKSVTTFLLASNPVPPEIIEQIPAPYANIELYPGKSPQLSVSATGTAPLSYQWISNNLPISGATNASYMPAASVEGITNDYVCIVSNAAGAVTSAVWPVTAVPAPTSSYAHAALALDPIGFWPLNEAEQGGGDDGVIARDYAGGNNGIYTNVLLGQLSYDALTDPSATSARFGYVALSNSCAFDILGPDFSMPAGSNAEFTVSAWANSTGANGINTPTIAAKGYYYQEEYALDAGAANESFRFSVRDAAGTAYNTSSTISLTNSGQWYHLVGVCDEARGLVLLYTNGALAASAAIPVASGITNSSETPMTIGARSSHPANGLDEQFPGYISDVAIYNYALSAGQIQTLYQSGVSLPPSGLAFTNVSGNPMTLNWTYGTLQSATNVLGPYHDLTNATPPYVIPFTNSLEFFRIREN